MPNMTERDHRWSGRQIAAVCLTFWLAAGCADPLPEPRQGQQQAALVYGEDNRLDWFEHPDSKLKELTQQSVAALVYLDQVDLRDPAKVQLTAQTLGARLSLCEGERFRDDPTAAFCSATLFVEQGLPAATS